jgi:hypothetical protein
VGDRKSESGRVGAWGDFEHDPSIEIRGEQRMESTRAKEMCACSVVEGIGCTWQRYERSKYPRRAVGKSGLAGHIICFDEVPDTELMLDPSTPLGLKYTVCSISRTHLTHPSLCWLSTSLSLRFSTSQVGHEQANFKPATYS